MSLSISVVHWLRTFALFLLCSTYQLEATPWQKIANNMELARFELSPGSILTPEVLLVRFPAHAFRISVLRSRQYEKEHMDAKTIAKFSHALIAINANFFDEHGKALGLVLSQGVKYQSIHNGGQTLTGIFYLSRNSFGIIHRNLFEPSSVVEAIQSGPRLLNQGKPIQGIKNSNIFSRRAGVCIDKQKNIILFITSGLIGITIEQLQKLLLQDDIGCLEALNLDGGGSAQLYISKDLPGAQLDSQELFLHGRDPVPVFIGIFDPPNSQP